MYFLTNVNSRRRTVSAIGTKSNKQRISEMIMGSKGLKILETALLISLSNTSISRALREIASVA